MNLDFLQGEIGGLPKWAWGLIVIGGGIGLYLFIRHQQGGGASSALGQQAATPIDTSQLDPYTGVPYNIESSTNPATGLPAYYGGPGVDPATQTPTPTPTPTPSSGNKVTTTTGSQNLQQYAAAYGTTPSNIYYNNLNSWLKSPGNYQKYLTAPIPAGKSLYLAGATQYPAPTGSGPSGPYQATPFWPVMTDVQAAQGAA